MQAVRQSPTTEMSTVPTAAIARPQRVESHERMRLRAAAFRAPRIYPGPVGQLISKELLDWESFGYRFGSDSLIAELVDHVMKVPTPPATVHV